jgi:hypothetical protein
VELYRNGTVSFSLKPGEAKVDPDLSPCAPPRATLKALRAEKDLISSHLDVLHDEMVRIPRHKRRGRWEEYYRRLDALVRHKEKLEKAIEALHPENPRNSAPSYLGPALDSVTP